MLTLLKQARAFGVGCILATQNPVDLDYKGLGNTGTWFIGRLQTERDKMRVLDGLEGASTSAGQSFDRGQIDTMLSGLGKRVFLMNNVHDNAPVLFHTRWVLSYLRGPLTRDHIESLMASQRKTVTRQKVLTEKVAAPGTTSISSKETNESSRPVVPASIKQCFFSATSDAADGDRLIYRPVLLASAKLHYANARAKVDEWTTVHFTPSFPDDGYDPDWESAVRQDAAPPDMDRKAISEIAFAALPSSANRAKNYATWQKMLKSHVYQNHAKEMWRCSALKMMSKPGESRGAFVARISQESREQRDLAVEKLRNRYTSKFSTVEQRIRRAEQKVSREESQYEKSRMSTVVSVGTTLLGALMGRKALSVSSMQRAATSINRAGSASKEKEDIGRAEEDLETAREQLQELESRFQDETAALKEKFDIEHELTPLVIRPRKTDISVSDMRIAWTPWSVDSAGIATPLHT